MTNYIIRRLMILPLIMFGVIALIFGMLQFLSPEERSALYVRDIPHNEQAMNGIIKRYGLDDPDLRAILALAGRKIRRSRWQNGRRNPARRLRLLTQRLGAGDQSAQAALPGHGRAGSLH